MTLQDDARPPREPATDVGLWLQALVFGPAARRRELAEKVGPPRGAPWRLDEPAVVEGAARLAAQERFGNTPDIERLENFVDFILNGLMSAPSAGRRPAPTRAESIAIITALFPRWEVDSSVAPETRYIMQGFIFLYCVRQLESTESEVVEIILQAERLAFSRGFNPPRHA